MSKVFALFAVGGAHAALDEKTKEAFRREGLSKKDLIEIGALVHELAPAYAQFQKNAPADWAKVGPPYEFFEKTLGDMGIEMSNDAIDHARRLWMRAQSMVLADDNRRFQLFRDDFSDIYQMVKKDVAASASAVAFQRAGSGATASAQKVQSSAATPVHEGGQSPTAAGIAAVSGGDARRNPD